MNLSLGHICIRTQDLEGTAKFYENVLGMKRVFEVNEEDDVKGYFFQISKRNYIEIRFDKDAIQNEFASARHLSFECDDLNSCLDKIRNAGVTTTDIMLGSDKTYRFWLKDPNGVELEFLQYTSASSQLTGASCCADW